MNIRLHYLLEQINRFQKELKALKPDQYKQTSSLLFECQEFVKSRLLEERKSKESLEKSIISSIQKDDQAAQIKLESAKILTEAPATLIGLLEAYGLQAIPDDLKQFLAFLDENILRLYLNEDDYKNMIIMAKEYMEDRF